jgi:hypothetical protein|tara:strand:- start:161 stop:319 length:159 start_codon:yes stop_codon:yes gene_type:complete
MFLILFIMFLIINFFIVFVTSNLPPEDEGYCQRLYNNFIVTGRYYYPLILGK